MTFDRIVITLHSINAFLLYVGGTSVRLSQKRVEEGDFHPEEAGGDGLLQDGAPPQSAQVSGLAAARENPCQNIYKTFII